MKTCKATFTIIDNEESKLNRTEVIEMVFTIDDNSNMIDSMLNYLSEEEEESKQVGSSIITNH